MVVICCFSDTKKILFVNRGVDISRPLSAQNDCFWWGYQNFSNLNKPYSTFIRIVRGYKSSNNEEIKDVNKRIVCSLFNQPLDNPKILAAIIATAVGIFSRNILATIFSGLASYWAIIFI